MKIIGTKSQTQDNLRESSYTREFSTKATTMDRGGREAIRSRSRTGTRQGLYLSEDQERRDYRTNQNCRGGGERSGGEKRQDETER